MRAPRPSITALEVLTSTLSTSSVTAEKVFAALLRDMNFRHGQTDLGVLTTCFTSLNISSAGGFQRDFLPFTQYDSCESPSNSRHSLDLNASYALMGFRGVDDLLAFVAVARTGSFKAAALQLDRDASVVSRRLSQLEKHLGVKLMIRTTRSVSLTEAGSFYFQRLRSILDELETATREVGDFAATAQGTLKISVPITFGRDIIAPIFSNIIEKYPKIRIDAHFEDRAVDVVGESFDLVVRVGLLPSSSLVSKRLGAFRSILVAAPAYIGIHGCPDIPEALKQHICLGFTKYPDWPNWTLEKDGQQVAVQPDCALIADSSEAVLVSALQGVGISLTPDWMAAPFLDDGRLVEVLPGWRSIRDIAVHALMPPGALIPAKTRIFVDELAATFRNEGFRWRK